MKSGKETIVPLKRVMLKLSAGKTPVGKELINAEPLEFIFGIGREGLTPLERRLAGKTVGEYLSLELYNRQVTDFFGHILPCPVALRNCHPSFYISMKIEQIETASAREVVRAMSQTTTGCGGDCGCGCAGHN